MNTFFFFGQENEIFIYNLGLQQVVGAIRNSKGDFIYGFSFRLDHTDILQAELEAILHGLHVCRERHLVRIEVESDSELACNMILNQATVAWKHIYLVRKIRKLLREVLGLRHIYKQANKVADGFAT